MQTVLYSKIDKSVLNTLPIESFSGEIQVISTIEEADKAVSHLLSSNILGIDTEQKPSFKKGVTHKVSLLQVCTNDICYLFRLNKIGLTPSLIQLLEDKKIPKVGLSLHDDIRMLMNRKVFKQGFFIDLQFIAANFGIEDLSLQKLYANFFHKRISKKAQLSNWESETLTPQQQLYAATDAWACLQIFNKMNELKQSNNYSTIKVVDGNEYNFTS